MNIRSILTITPMFFFFGALGFGLLAFTTTTDAAKPVQCLITHYNGSSGALHTVAGDCEAETICVSDRSTKRGHSVVHKDRKFTGDCDFIDKMDGTSDPVTQTRCIAADDC